VREAADSFRRFIPVQGLGDMTPGAAVLHALVQVWMAPPPPIMGRIRAARPLGLRARRRVSGGGFIIAQQVVSDVTGVVARFPEG